MLTALELFTLTPTSTLRPPGWRWELARELRNRPRPDGRLPSHSDPDVDQAIIVQEASSRCESEAERHRLLQLIKPHAADAYVFRRRADISVDTPINDTEDYPLFSPLTADAIAKSELEALVLARKKPETISRVTGLSVDAVNQYEKWWFDVRDRLDRPGWVATNVIGTLHQGDPGTLLPALIKAYGYYTRSARVVRTAAGMFDAQNARSAADNPNSFFTQDALTAGGLKAAIAVRLMPLNKRTYARVMELHQAATEIANKNAVEAGSEDSARFRDAVSVLADRIDRRYGAAPTDPPTTQSGLKIISSITDIG